VLSRALVAQNLRASLEEEGRWPDWHLLWEQHPLVEWLFDALGAAYARGEAPMVRAPALGKSTALYLLQGIFYNHESEAVLARFFAIEADLSGSTPRLAEAPVALEEVLRRTGFGPSLANPDKPFPQHVELEKLVPTVVAQARASLAEERRKQVQGELMRKVRKETRRLEDWLRASRDLLDKQEALWSRDGRRVPAHVALRLGRERDHLLKVKANHEQLLKSVSAQGDPYLRLVAVFTGEP
jgi:hypothetical protein